jgi:hypothetical protein
VSVELGGVLGSSVPGASSEQKRRPYSRFTDLRVTATVTLQCPNKGTVPSLGTKCGRRERESRREGRREQSLRDYISPSRVVAVKGIPVVWKAALFAERRRNAGLDRPIVPAAVSPAAGRCAGDSGCPEDAEEGNAVGMRHQAHAPNARTRDRCMRFGDASFTRSFDPWRVDPHYAPRAQRVVVRRSSRHHGWASSRKREEPSLGPLRLDMARLAACHRFRKGEGVTRQKRKEVKASVPARIEGPGLVARTSLVCCRSR